MTVQPVGTSRPAGDTAGPAAHADATQGLGLAPLRESLIARARATADALLAAAETERSGAIADAQHDIAELLAQARAQGRADGEELLASERASARASDRARLLAAQRRVYESLRTACLRRVHDLLAEPGARDRLTAVVSRRLGRDAVVVGLPEGGLVARTADGRSVDASVSALVDSALADHDLGALWTLG